MSAPVTTAPLSSSHRLVIAIMVLSTFVVILNETTLAVALPHLMDDLQIDAPTAQWVSTGFLLTMAVVIPITGFLVQRFATRTLYVLAMGLFISGTVISMLAPGFSLLLVGRVIQASGTAVMAPLLMTTILQLVPQERRGQVIGMVMVVNSVAPALGPTVSGIILYWLSWRWIFLLVLIVTLVIAAIGLWKLTNVNEPRVTRLDWASLPLSALGFGSLVYALNLLGQGRTSLFSWAVLAVGVVSLVAFTLRQLHLQRVGDPLLDLRTLTHRPFRVGLGMLMAGFASLLGVAIVWPIYLQNVHGINEIVTGLLLLPGGLAMGLLGPRIGRLHDRIGARRIAVPAAFAMVAILALMSRVTQTTPEPLLLALHFSLSLALAFVFTPVFTSALNSLPPALYSHGSATLGALQQVAGATGVAVLVAIMAAVARSAGSSGSDGAQATLAGIQVAFTVAAGIACVAIVLGFLLPRTAPAEDPLESDDEAAEPSPSVPVGE